MAHLPAVMPNSKDTCQSSKIDEMQYCVTNHIDLGKFYLLPKSIIRDLGNITHCLSVSIILDLATTRKENS